MTNESPQHDAEPGANRTPPFLLCKSAGLDRTRVDAQKIRQRPADQATGIRHREHRPRFEDRYDRRQRNRRRVVAQLRLDAELRSLGTRIGRCSRTATMTPARCGHGPTTPTCQRPRPLCTSTRSAAAWPARTRGAPVTSTSSAGFAGQIGTWYAQTQRAHAAAAERGFQWSNVAARPWLRAGFFRASGDADPVENPIRMMEREHREAADELRAIRELTRGYAAPADGCTTYAVCMAELARFESDLHCHVRLENTVLFSKAISLQSASGLREQDSIGGIDGNPAAAFCLWRTR